jgi:hypothetical protein
MPTDIGILRQDTIMFCDAEFAAGVTAYLWSDLDEVQKPFLTWLREIALRGDPWFRKRAVRSLAECATRDFARVYQHVLAPLIHGDVNAQVTLLEVFLLLARGPVLPSMAETITGSDEDSVALPASGGQGDVGAYADTKRAVAGTSRYWMTGADTTTRWIGATVAIFSAGTEDESRPAFLNLRSLVRNREKLFGVPGLELADRIHTMRLVGYTYRSLVAEGQFDSLTFDLEQNGDIVFWSAPASADHSDRFLSLIADLCENAIAVKGPDGDKAVWPFIPWLFTPQADFAPVAKRRWKARFINALFRVLDDKRSQSPMKESLETWFASIDATESRELRDQLFRSVSDVMKNLAFRSENKQLIYRGFAGDRLFDFWLWS